MRESEKISIVTPSYNQAAFIARTILSVKNQQYSNIEHIIIDGGSTDGTCRILEKYGDILWKSESDRGQADAVNKGFKMSTGSIVGWLNSDDTYEKDVVPFIMAEFNKFRSVDMIYGDCNYIDENDNITYTYRAPTFDLRRLISCGFNYVPQPACFVRRRVLDEVGLLDTSLEFAMDHDLFIRIGLHRFKIKKVNRVLANFRKHSHSKTVSSILSLRKESFKLGRKYGTGVDVLSTYLNWILTLIILSSPLAKMFRKRITTTSI